MIPTPTPRPWWGRTTLAYAAIALGLALSLLAAVVFLWGCVLVIEGVAGWLAGF